MTAHRRNIAIGAAFLAALLLAVIIPDFRRGAASLSHPDPVGPTVYSKSAIGHAAFYRLLRQLEIPVETSERGSGGHVGPDDVLVIAEPRTDDPTLNEVKVMLNARSVLLVLPKRTGKADAGQPYWIGEDHLLSAEAVNRVLHLADGSGAIVRSGTSQAIRSTAMRPIVTSSVGMLIGERRTPTGRVLVLADPDILSNHGLARGENAASAVNLVDNLRAGHPAGRLIFDEFVHGFSPKPFHLLGILFQFPFVLVTMQMGLAIALLFWAATGRFGAPDTVAPPLAAGKRSLIDTGARLLIQTGRVRGLYERYIEEMIRDAAAQASAAPGRDAAASPQQIWHWRKAVLGEPRRHTQLNGTD
jgi:hypothetical protein